MQSQWQLSPPWHSSSPAYKYPVGKSHVTMLLRQFSHQLYLCQLTLHTPHSSLSLVHRVGENKNTSMWLCFLTNSLALSSSTSANSRCTHLIVASAAFTGYTSRATNSPFLISGSHFDHLAHQLHTHTHTHTRLQLVASCTWSARCDKSADLRVFLRNI